MSCEILACDDAWVVEGEDQSISLWRREHQSSIGLGPWRSRDPHHTRDVENDEQFHNRQRQRLSRQHRKALQHTRLAEELERLRRRSATLETLCGFRECSLVVGAAVTLQAAVRGWILRSDQAIFERCVALFFRWCRTSLARRRFLKARNAARVLQAHVRGRRARATPVGRALAAIASYRQDVAALEMLTLRLTASHCLNTTQVVIE